MESLDLLNPFRRHIPSEWHCEVISESKKLATLVLQVVDQLTVLAVLPRKCLLELKHRRINLTRTMLEEHILDLVEGFLANGHHHWRHIAGALGTLGQTALLVSHLQDLGQLAVQLFVQRRVETLNVWVA